MTTYSIFSANPAFINQTRFWLFIVLTSVFVFTGTMFASAQDLSGVEKTSFDLNQAAYGGSAKDAEKSLEALQKLHDQYPDNNVVLAFLGSVYTINAREAKVPMSKLYFLNKGLGLLDKAVANAPEDFTVRVTSANVNLEIPDNFGRKPKAVEDMIACDRIFRANPYPSMAEFMIPIYKELQKLAPNKGDWSTGLAQAEELVG